jgi:hypothetical protein
MCGLTKLCFNPLAERIQLLNGAMDGRVLHSQVLMN